MSTSSYFSMVDSTSDLHVVETRPLMSPALLHRDLPLDKAASELSLLLEKRFNQFFMVVIQEFW